MGSISDSGYRLTRDGDDGPEMHTPSYSRRWALVGLLLLAGFHGVGASHQPAGGTHGIPPNETAKLWSLDADQYVNESQYQNQTGETRTAMEALLNGTDYVWTAPPDLPSKWNRRDWAAYSQNFSTTRTRSMHPQDAQLRESNRGWIQDAHATLYRIQPSTRLYRTPEETIHYIAPEGRVRGLVDYRVQMPDNDTDRDGEKVVWTLDRHEITSLCVVQGPANPRQGGCQQPSTIGVASTPGHTANISYAARPYATSGTPFSLVSRIEVELKKTVKTKHSKTEEKCRTVDTGDGEKTVCETVTTTWWTSNTTHVTDHVTVTDQVSTTVYQFRTALRAAEFPNGDRGIIMQSADHWSGLTVGSQASMTTHWQYFSAREPAWDRLGTTTADETSWTDSPAVPARVYAVPGQRNVTVQSSANATLRDVTALERPPQPSPAPALPENVSVAVPEDSYNATKTLAVRYSGPNHSATATGVVNGVSSEIVQSQNPVTIHEANLTLSVIDWNTSYVNVRVTLRDNRTGDPINTSGRDGYVKLREQRVETNESGSAVVTVENTGLVTAQYEPAVWWSGDVGYLSDRAQVLPRSGIFSRVGFGRTLSNILELVMPILFVLFLLDQFPGAETWPPWRVFR